jgi:hypothetical protein
MRPYYGEGSNLTELVDVDNGDFYEYQDYVYALCFPRKIERASGNSRE